MRPIDAHSFQKTIREYRDSYPNAPTRQAVCNIFLSMLGDENQAPTIDLESLRPQGKWISYHEADLGWDEWGCRCSNCKWEVEDEKITFPMNYCPNCGARMKGAGDGV